MINNESIKKGIAILDKADAESLVRFKRNTYMKLYMRKYRTNMKSVKLTSDIHPIEQVEA